MDSELKKVLHQGHGATHMPISSPEDVGLDRQTVQLDVSGSQALNGQGLPDAVAGGVPAVYTQRSTS